MLENFLPSKKTIQCSFCPKKEISKKMWKLDINTAEGVVTKNICPDCARALEEIKSSYFGEQ